MCKNKGCGCSETTTEYKKCNECSPKPCDCEVKDLKTDCIIYSGEGLGCTGVEKNTPLTETLEQIDSYICESLEAINTSVNLVNVGDGVEVYKGIDSLGKREIRTITGGENVTISETENTVNISVTEAEQNNIVRQIIIAPYNLPNDYTEQDICDYILALPEAERTILEFTSKVNVIIGYEPS